LQFSLNIRSILLRDLLPALNCCLTHAPLMPTYHQ
jgi:hypothetical protein